MQVGDTVYVVWLDIHDYPEARKGVLSKDRGNGPFRPPRTPQALSGQ